MSKQEAEVPPTSDETETKADDATVSEEPRSRRRARSAAKDPEAEPQRRIPAAPPIAGRWVRLLLGLGVAVAVGLAPFLGKVDVPGFVSLLSVFPESIQTLAIAVSSFVMAVIAASVQFYGASRAPEQVLRTWFPRLVVSLFALLSVLVVVHVMSVARVEYGDGQFASFVIGFGDRRASCSEDCPDSMANQECIHHLGLASEAVESCWGDRAVRVAEIALLFVYLLVTGSFGALVGLLTLQMSRSRRRR